MKMNTQTTLRNNIAAFAASLPAIDTVASGYDYRASIAQYWRDCATAINAIMPQPCVCGAGNGEWIDYGRATTPTGVMAQGQKAHRQWMSHARAVAIAAGATPVFLGVANALAENCSPAAVSA